jgi:hypothetical protein
MFSAVILLSSQLDLYFVDLIIGYIASNDMMITSDWEVRDKKHSRQDSWT